MDFKYIRNIFLFFLGFGKYNSDNLELVLIIRDVKL